MCFCVFYSLSEPTLTRFCSRSFWAFFFASIWLTTWSSRRWKNFVEDFNAESLSFGWNNFVSYEYYILRNETLIIDWKISKLRLKARANNKNPTKLTVLRTFVFVLLRKFSLAVFLSRRSRNFGSFSARFFSFISSKMRFFFWWIFFSRLSRFLSVWDLSSLAKTSRFGLSYSYMRKTRTLNHQRMLNEGKST